MAKKSKRGRPRKRRNWRAERLALELKEADPGVSMRSIARALDDRYPLRPEGRRWHHGDIPRLLKNAGWIDESVNLRVPPPVRKRLDTAGFEGDRDVVDELIHNLGQTVRSLAVWELAEALALESDYVGEVLAQLASIGLVSVEGHGEDARVAALW